MIILNAVGLNCPMPVIMAKKQFESGDKRFGITVDNQIAVENLTRLAESQNAGIFIKQDGANYTIEFVKDSSMIDRNHENKKEDAIGNWVLFVGRDILGEGDRELGDNLIKMFFYTLMQGNDLPQKIMFVNSGVSLVTENIQVIEHLKALEAKGCKIMACGACLNFYGLSQNLAVGKVSNMLDILTSMQSSPKVITL